MIRLAGFLALAWGVGAMSRAISVRENRRTDPAGFPTGLLHGAAMPCAVPALLMGADPVIYATLNTGRSYKLGYTVGVNLCGAVFFGVFYRRFARSARARDRVPLPTSSSAAVSTAVNESPAGGGESGSS